MQSEIRNCKFQDRQKNMHTENMNICVYCVYFKAYANERAFHAGCPVECCEIHVQILRARVTVSQMERGLRP